MRRYYFPIFHKGETQADDVGELFGSAQLAVQYGARVARDIASDPEQEDGRRASQSRDAAAVRRADRSDMCSTFARGPGDRDG